MTNQTLSTHEHHMIQQFEQTYDALVVVKGQKVKAHMLPAFYHPECKQDLAMEQHMSYEPAYQVQIGQEDLVKLVRVLQDQQWHDHVQNRYPHLREAYMNYLSQVYLTVDSLNRY